MKGRPKKKIDELVRRVNISLDPKVHKSAKIMAKKKGKSLSRIINDKLKRMK